MPIPALFDLFVLPRSSRTSHCIEITNKSKITHSNSNSENNIELSVIFLSSITSIIRFPDVDQHGEGR